MPQTKGKKMATDERLLPETLRYNERTMNEQMSYGKLDTVF